MYMDKEGTTLATEIFKELKASAKRWFIAFLLMCGVELATIAGFIWYISLPTDYEQVEIENDEGNANYVGGNVGGDLNNGQNNSNEKTEGRETPEEITEIITE